MGMRRRIIKGLSPNVPVVDTGLEFNGSRVFLESTGDPALVRKFGSWLGNMAFRAGQFTMGDYYSVYFGMRSKLLNGEMWN